MSKKTSKTGKVVVPPVENGPAMTETGKVVRVSAADFKMPLGRPSNPDSARQKQLTEKAELIAAGKVFKQGRPTNPTSKHAIAKAALAERQAQPGYVAAKGRPAVEGSARQVKLAAQAARKAAAMKAAGIEVAA